MRIKELIFYCCIALHIGDCTRSCNARVISEAYMYVHKSACTWPQAISFEEKIRLIAEQVGVWHHSTELFRSMDFAVMYRHPKTYHRYVIQLLKDPQIPLEHKQIALYGMEQLDVTDYIKIAQHCCTWYRSGTFPRVLLEMAMAYDLAGDHPMVIHYQDKSVQEVLYNVQQQNSLPADTLAYFMAIQTGKMCRMWQAQNKDRTFQWAKTPLSFSDAVDAMIEQSKWGINDIYLEGQLRGTVFMMLYEHPEYYVDAAHQLVTNSVPEPNSGGLMGIKYTLNGKRNEIVFNAMRKLNEKDFLLLFKKIYTLGLRQRLIGDIAGSYYDTLLLKPYPFSSIEDTDLPQAAWKDLKRYQGQQKKQEKMRKLYNIPSYNDAKPFYHFGGGNKVLAFDGGNQPIKRSIDSENI